MLSNGLDNKNNDCYINSCIQLLCRIKNIQQLINNNNNESIILLKEIIMKLLNKENLSDQVQKLKSIMKFNNQQHDAFDFLINILDIINDQKNFGTHIKKKFYKVVPKKKLIRNIYKHKYFSDNITFYNIIEVYIENNDQRYILDILMQQSAKYILQNIDTIQLQIIDYEHKKYKNAYEIIDYYPNKYMFIRLQLFNHLGEKKTHNIKLSKNNELIINNNKYILISFICHIGSNINHGHYVCYNYDNNNWYLYNDNYISQTNDYQGEPYILLYVLN